MNMLLAFAPFISFVVIERLVGVTPGLAAGALVSAALVARDLFTSKRSIKVLEAGTFVLFTGLAVYAAAQHSTWPIVGVRLRVDAGLLLIVLFSVAIRRPFTLQYAREQTSSEIWTRPEFIRVNYVITLVWAAAFAAMVAADIAMLYVPAVPVRLGIIVTAAAIYGAYRFTAWYPQRERASAVASDK